MEEGLNLIQNHLSSFWNWVIGVFVVLGGFLISKKAILAGMYYLLNIFKLMGKFIKGLFSKKQEIQKRKKQLFWDTDLTFKEALHKNQTQKEEEFYHWLQFLLQEGILTDEKLSRLPIYTVFVQYSTLNTIREKQQFAKSLSRELKEGIVHSHGAFVNR